MAKPTSMSEIYFKDAREYLVFEHHLRKTRRPSYSMRAFARDLAISPSSLNDFLRARVGMSPSRIERISRILNWSDSRKQHFRELIQSKHERDPVLRQTALVSVRRRLKEGSFALSLEAFKIISDWYHLAIIELCSIRNHLDVSTIATELKLNKKTVRLAVARLLNLKLLSQTEFGLKPVTDSNHFGDVGSSEAIKTFHSQVLELAQNALQKNDQPAFDSQSFFYSVEQKKLSQMNSEIRHAVLAIVNRYAQTEKADCIQALTLQIFPIWQPNYGDSSL
jgi:uncharacterized protein (TIGR02147 family)